MGRYLHILTATVSANYQKRKKLRNKQFCFIKLNNFIYPAVINVSKRGKEKPFLIENGCIPDELRAIEDFEIDPDIKWCYTKAVTFKHVTNDIMGIDTSLKVSKITPSNNDVIKLPENLDPLYKFFKYELEAENLLLKKGMKVCVHYISQKLFFEVVNIEPYSPELMGEMISKIAFKCYIDTKIEIIDDIVKKKICEHIYSFKDFGGYESEIKNLKDSVDNYYNGSSSVSGVLISGISGTGKSYLLSILNDLYDNCFSYSSEDIISTFRGETESNLRKIFGKANKRVPSLLIIDNIDEICIGRGEDISNTRVVNALLHLIDGGETNQQTLVVATTSKPEKLDQALRRPGRLSHDITFNIPDEQSRLSILKIIFESFSLDIRDSDVDSLCAQVAARTSGFVAADLKNLLAEAASYTNDELVMPSWECFCQALNVVKPISLKDVATHYSKATFDDVMNYSEIKTELKSLVEWTIKRKKLLFNHNITPPTRILLFGPAGCGKTLMTQALANQFALNIIVVKRSNVFGKYFGESEKNLESLFGKAKKSSPCILHFENFSGVAGKKSRDAEVSNDVEGRVINHLKVMFDGVQSLDNVFVVAETNRPDLLDGDVIRHGRFHKYIFVDLPSYEDRKKILEFFLRDILSNLKSNSWSLDTLAKETKGFSVAEVKLLCKEIQSFHDDKLSTITLDETLSEDFASTAIEEALEIVSAGNSSRVLKKCAEFASIYCKDYAIVRT